MLNFAFHLDFTVRRALMLLVALLAVASPSFGRAAESEGQDIAVRVQKAGAWVRVDVEFVVDATMAQAWNVLTDYDNMEKIVSNVEESRIIKREGHRLEVAQKGRAGVGALAMKFENVREIVLSPQHEIRSKMISGDMKSSEFTTRITSEGERTRITNHGEYLPAMWVPPVVGPAFIEAETRKQFSELRSEIMRRKAAGVRP